jgi:hypothetical protein
MSRPIEEQLKMRKSVTRIAILAVSAGLILVVGTYGPFRAESGYSAQPERPRERVAIGPKAGDVGYLDPSAFDAPANGEPEGRDGPFLVFDAPEGGKQIFWYFHSVGLRPIGQNPTDAEKAATPPVVTYLAPPGTIPPGK